MGEVVPLKNDIEYLGGGKQPEPGKSYKPRNFGQIGDALVYPWKDGKRQETIKILRIVEEGEGGYCDTESGEVEEGYSKGFVEVLFQGGIIRTTTQVINDILELREEEIYKRA